MDLIKYTNYSRKVNSPDRVVLKDRGLRVTAARMNVMDVLVAHSHKSADAIAGLVRTRIGTVSDQTIYNVLASLVDAGILRRIEPADSPALYERRIDDNHHHVICRRCGRVEDVDCALGDRPCLNASDDHGFQIDEAEVIYWGHCPQCQQAKDSSSPIPPIHTQ